MKENNEEKNSRAHLPPNISTILFFFKKKLKWHEGQGKQLEQKGQSRDKQEATETTQNLFFVKPALVTLQHRVDRGESHGGGKGKKITAIFEIAFSRQCRVKSGGESFEIFKQPWQPGCSGINLFKQAENPCIINIQRDSKDQQSVYRRCQIKKIKIRSEPKVFRNISTTVFWKSYNKLCKYKNFKDFLWATWEQRKQAQHWHIFTFKLILFIYIFSSQNNN